MYKVIDDYEAIERFYGDADSEYIDKCQNNGIPDEDIEHMVAEYGEEIMGLLEEI